MRMLVVDDEVDIANMLAEYFRMEGYEVVCANSGAEALAAASAGVAPDIMLLDEPFGAIDAITRAKLQDELLRIHRGSGKTFIFVTHDVTEALKLGTKVLVVDAGRAQQYATPEELLTHPATPFVRELLETQGYTPEGRRA